VFTPPKRPDGAFRLPKNAINWNRDKIESWCREKLCGAPPSKPKQADTGIELEWRDVKMYAGRNLKLSTSFKGLVMGGVFERAVQPPMTRKGSKKTSSEESLLNNISDIKKTNVIEEKSLSFWDEVEALVGWYNRYEMKGVHTAKEMWRAGEAMQAIKENANKGIDFEFVGDTHLYYSIEAWGTGIGGYRAVSMIHSLELYRWLREEGSEHPFLKHRTSPTMKFIMAEHGNRERRYNLFSAFDSGPLKGVSDLQLEWVLGMSLTSFPHQDRIEELQSIRETIACGNSLSTEERNTLTELLAD
jgi:hypothetical protein